MGLNHYLAREVLRARADGSVSAVATVGQLQQFLLPAQIAQLRREFDLDEAAWTRAPYGAYARDFFSAIGVEELVAIDASDYEDADLIHDMNEPVPAELHDRFDLVVDGGSIEHIFRPDVALANTLRMTRVGGHAIVWAPANNQCGHGFYQFSPEFFFSALTERAGVSLTNVLLVECVFPSVSLVAPRRAYHVKSPREARERVEVLSRRPLMLLARAQKQRHVEEPFATTPQQSDYESEWEGATPDESPLFRWVQQRYSRIRHHPAAAGAGRRFLGMRQRLRYSLRNRDFFIPDR